MQGGVRNVRDGDLIYPEAEHMRPSGAGIAAYWCRTHCLQLTHIHEVSWHLRALQFGWSFSYRH